MMIQTQMKFETFNDGIVDLYQTDDDDNIIKDSKITCRFGSKTIGVKRYFAARSNDIELDRLISIHKNMSVVTDMAAVIQNTRYKIIQIQHINDTNPPTTTLSLSQRGLYQEACDDV